MQKKQKQASLTDFFVKNCFHCKYSGRMTGLKRRPGRATAGDVRYLHPGCAPSSSGIGSVSGKDRPGPGRPRKTALKKNRMYAAFIQMRFLSL